jgi:HAMP domain-containing protein
MSAFDVHIRQTDRGRGVFAARSFRRGELILGATGTVISHQTEYSIQIDRERHLDTDPPARYLNHSCDPNAGVRTNENGLPDFIARRDIQADEEITYDYAMTEFRHYERQRPELDFDLTCRCGSKNCRGKLGYYSELSDELKATYRGLVSAYLVGRGDPVRAGASTDRETLMSNRNPPNPKRAFFLSLRWKLLIGFTLLFTVVFAGAYYWFYTFSTQAAVGRIQEDLVETLHAAVKGVDSDALEALAKEGQAGRLGAPEADPRYLEHQAWLGTVHEIEPRANPYTYIKGAAPNEILWVGDIFRIIRPEDGTAFLDSYTSTGPLIQGLTEETVNLQDPYTDEWGYWVSAYTPIRNSTGETVGGFGIDFDATYVLQVQAGIRNSMVIAFAVTYLTLFALVFIISGAFTQPVMALTRAAERIGEGDYEQNLSGLSGGRFPDEIGTLARVFTIMVDKVYQREQTLRRQVEELKIEIDEVKRQKQVSEIVDSDFFQDLQARAREMRQRGRRGGEARGENEQAA